jgi:RimJ/RimL family protein N-acetyltransferase
MESSLPGSGPIYRICSQRLVIRCWHPSDAPLLKIAIDESREHLKPWMPWAHGEPEDIGNYIERLRRFRGKFDLSQDFVFGIFDQAEQIVLGGTGLHTRVGESAREIGYWIHQDHIGIGLATETVSALLKVAIAVEGMHRVEIHCDPNNVRSSAVPKKLGFTLEAVLKKRQRSLDQWLDVMIWTMFADKYYSSSAAAIEIEAYDVIDRRIL